MAKDTQKSKVYDWQDLVFEYIADSRPDLFVELPLDVCQSFVDKICTVYGVESPRCVTHRYENGATAHYNHWHHRITLPNGWARCARTVAHEAAHCITDHLYSGTDIASHGAEFVRIYADIMARFLHINVDVIEQSLAVDKIRVLPVSPVPGVYSC